MYGDLTVFKMAAVRHLGFFKNSKLHSVLRRPGQTYPRKHHVHPSAVQPPGVCRQTTHRTGVVGLSAGDYRRGPKAADIDITQNLSAGRSACLSSEGLRGRLCTGYHHTRQLVTADRAVSSTLQVSASAAAAKEGGARPIVAGQLQTYIELIDSLQGARAVSYTHLTLPTTPYV